MKYIVEIKKTNSDVWKPYRAYRFWIHALAASTYCKIISNIQLWAMNVSRFKIETRIIKISDINKEK